MASTRTVQRIERLIALAAPALDLVLAAGDRVSRIVAPPDHEHGPVRPAGEPTVLEAPPDSRADATDGGHA